MVSVADFLVVDTQATQLGANLRELLHYKVINYVRVFNFIDFQPQYESSEWSFDDSVMRVGDQVYCMKQLLRYKITNQTLTLHI